MSYVALRSGSDLTEGRFRRCSRAIAHDDRSVTGKQDEITTGKRNRLRDAFNIEPAIAAREHGEVRQLLGFRPSTFKAPWGGGFQPVLTESGYVQCAEDICYRVQLLPHCLDEWTKSLDS